MAAAGVIIILVRRRPGIGSTWMIATVASVLAWLILAGSPTRFFQEVNISGWLPYLDKSIEIAFRLDRSGWEYALAIASLSVAVLFTSSARIHVRNEAMLWAGSLLLSAIGLLASAAQTPVSMILIWTLLDIAELGFILYLRSDRPMNASRLASFTWRGFGTLIFMGVIILATGKGGLPEFKELPPLYFPAIFLVIILRLGIFPLHPEVSRQAQINRSAGNVIDLIAPASALVLLSRLEGSLDAAFWVGMLFALTLIYMLYTAFQWASSPGELHGRSFWIFSLACFAMYSAANGQQQFSATWGMILLLGGGSLFLAFPRNRWVLIPLMIVFFGISGIPGSPSMAAWTGITAGASFLAIPLFLIAAVFLNYGFLKFSQRFEGDFAGVDRWVRVVFPAGIAIFAISQWIIFIRTLPASFSFETWWCGVLVMVLTLAVFFWKAGFVPKRARKWGERFRGLERLKIGARLESFFSFGWFNRIVAVFFEAVHWLLNLISGVLEGEGGILWAILLLVLLISYLQFGFTR